MASNTLLLAQLDAAQVIDHSTSRASGTGAFLLDSVQHTLSYELTYQGLEAGGARSIALYNFGRGKNGAKIATLCGPHSRSCPKTASATIKGSVERDAGGAIDNPMVKELDAERVYVEIMGGNGKPEIRGQLGANGAMVRVQNYIAHLAPTAGSGSKGHGTAIVSETYLPGGRVSVFYAATVADTAGSPTRAALLGGPAAASAAPLSTQGLLPQMKLLSALDLKTGGSISGSYEINTQTPDALFAARLLATNHGEARIVVSTGRYPEGELYGNLMPVH